MRFVLHIQKMLWSLFQHLSANLLKTTLQNDEKLQFKQFHWQHRVFPFAQVYFSHILVCISYSNKYPLSIQKIFKSQILHINQVVTSCQFKHLNKLQYFPHWPLLQTWVANYWYVLMLGGFEIITRFLTQFLALFS